MYFRANFKKTNKNPRSFQFKKKPEKTQGPQKKPQEPKIASKNPRSWEKTQAVATLDSTTACDNHSANRKSVCRTRETPVTFVTAE